MSGRPDEELRARLEALPEGGAVVVVVPGADEDVEEAAARAERVATAAGRVRPHVVLAATGRGARLLDGLLRADGPGLEAVFAGTRSLAQAAVRGSGDFVYLPSGLPEEGDEPRGRAAAIRALRLARTVSRAGGTLVLLLDAATAADPGLSGEMDLRLKGGAPEETAGREAAGRERPDRQPGDGQPADRRAAGEEPDDRPDETGRWRRHRKRTGPPVGRIVLGAALILVLFGGWWLGARYLSGGGDGPRTGGTPEAIADTAAAPGPAGASTEGEAGAGETGASRAGAGKAGAGNAAAPERASADTPAARTAPQTRGEAALVQEAPELPYSVLIASYARREDAVRRAREWSRDDGILYVVAPTPIQGRLYYRLLAGALPSRDVASRLMDRLVDRGRKDEARAWDVRPTSLAFRLGVSVSRAAAAGRADSLREAGIPAYVLPAAASGDTAWQIYGGAFEARSAAGALEEMIRKAGLDARLVTRRGTKG